MIHHYPNKFLKLYVGSSTSAIMRSPTHGRVASCDEAWLGTDPGNFLAYVI